jgi:predicted nucleic acid-binding protein
VAGIKKIFIDTNIFIYQYDGRYPAKQGQTMNILRNAFKNNIVFISTQVLKEFTEVCIRKLGLSQAEIIVVVGELAKINMVEETPELIKRALEIHFVHQYSFYDSLIITAALQAGCEILYTEDMGDGQVVDGLKIVNPFA